MAHDSSEDSSATRFSLGAKLAMATVAVLLIVSVVVYAVLTRAARHTLLDDKTKAAAIVADLFAANVTAPLDFGDDKDVDHELQNLTVDRDLSYAAVWRDGNPRPVAVFGVAGTSPLPAPSTITAAGSRLLPDAVEVTRRVERPDGTALGQAVLRFSLAPEYAAIAQAQSGIFYGTAFTLWLTAFLILAVTRFQIVRPLGRLADAALRLQKGEHSVRVDVGSRDEVGRLAAVFNTMSAAIVDREEHLAEALAQIRELFDHMRQGIVVFGPDGLAREAPSTQAKVIFGPDLERQPVLELLYRGAPPDGPERQAFEAWLTCAFDVPPSAWDEVASLAPPRVERARGDGRQWLELQWSPVLKNGRIDRVMLLATDVTHERELEREAEEREEEHAREMAAMRRLLAGGGQAFASFLEVAGERVDAVVRAAEAGRPYTRAKGDLLMHVHTLRGEARTFELKELASVCEGLERLLRGAENDPDAVDDAWKARAVASGEAARSHVERARERFIEASPIGRAVLDQMTVRRSDVRGLERHADTVPADARRLIEALSSRPFGECVTGLEAAAVRWAVENGKRVRVVIEGRDARIPGPIAKALTGVLPHLVRNSLAHGIETPDRRRAGEKDEVGTIRIAAAESPLSVRVEDDGAGLDDEAIRERGHALGLKDTAVSELVFVGGLSTFQTPTAVAGYGVGLAAALRDLAAVGCGLTVDSAKGKGVEVSVFVRGET